MYTTHTTMPFYTEFGWGGYAVIDTESLKAAQDKMQGTRYSGIDFKNDTWTYGGEEVVVLGCGETEYDAYASFTPVIDEVILATPIPVVEILD